MVKEKEQHSTKTEELYSNLNELILFNDDINTFNFVIETLIDVCEHDAFQAEQCTLIVHFKGKCAVKSGGFHELNPICKEMINRGLVVEIK